MKTDFDIDVLEKFFDEFDYWGTLGWLQAIMNGGIDLDVLRECVRKHSEDTLGSYLPDNLFIKKDIEEVSDEYNC